MLINQSNLNTAVEPFDPEEIARAALLHQAEMQKIGISITTPDAVRRVLNERRLLRRAKQ